MKRSHVRRLMTVVQTLGAAGLVAALVHCGGGTNPPAASEDTVDSGFAVNTVDAGSTVVSFPDIDTTKGITFGEGGFTDCGKQAQVEQFTIKNNSNEIVNFKATLNLGSTYYAVSPTAGGILANGQTTIQLTPTQIPATSDITDDLYAGTLELDFPGNGVPIDIPLHQTARGAIVALTGGTGGSNGTPATFALGQVKVGETSSLPLAFSNAGNLDVKLNLSLGGLEFKIDGNQTEPNLDLPPGGAASPQLVAKPDIAGDLTDTLSIGYDTSAVFCSPPPTSATVTATGTTSVGISPGTLDFGQVNCGSTALPQPITITSTIAMTFTPTLALGGTSPFKLTDSTNAPITLGSSIQLAAASTYTLNVVPTQIPASAQITDNLFGDTLKITTSVPGDVEHDIILKMGAKGAILSFAPANGISNTSATTSTSTTTPFAIVNSGNAVVPYTLKLVNNDGSAPSSTLTQTFNIGGNSSVTGNLSTGNNNLVLTSISPSTFNTTVEGALELDIPAGQPLCADVPARYDLKSTTEAGTSITLDPPALQFGQVNCGSTAAPQVVTVSSVVSTTFTPDLVQGANSSFVLENDANGTTLTLGQPINISAGGTYKIRVVPNAIPTRPLNGTTNNAFGDTMTIKSPVDPTKNYDIEETAKGVIYSWNPTIINLEKGGSVAAFTLVNSGNVTGEYDITTTAGSVNITHGSAPQGNTPGVLTGTNPGTIHVTSTSLLCADLPGDIVVTESSN